MNKKNKPADLPAAEKDQQITNFVGAALSSVAVTIPEFGKRNFLPEFLIALVIFLIVAALVSRRKKTFTPRFGWLFIAFIASFLLGLAALVSVYLEYHSTQPDLAAVLNPPGNIYYLFPLAVFGFCFVVSLAVMGVTHLAGRFLFQTKTAAKVPEAGKK